MTHKQHHNTQGAVKYLSAWLDALQGLSGLLLVLFMWMHMFLESSILLGEEAMYHVARFFEGVYFFGKPYPILVSLIATAIFALVVLHAVIALRKLPADYRQFSAFSSHSRQFKHTDTRLWLVQVITGVLLMFIVGIHLYQMFSVPDGIGPYASADRVWSGNQWPMYLVLLICVQFHACIGIYRLIIKWDLFACARSKRRRYRLRQLMWLVLAFFLLLGLASLAAYMKLGIEHAPQRGERFHLQGANTVQDKGA